MEDKKLGCKHYDRGCKMVCPTCEESFWCRHCHNEKYEFHSDPKKSHLLDRKKVMKIICGNCEKEQSIKNKCEDCGLVFGEYYCEECRFYDNKDRGQFHCDKCGICRIGGSENFFHCDKCNACLSISLKDNHKCIDGTLKQNCPVCLEYLMDSTDASMILKCGHSIHKKCVDSLLKSRVSKCPLCNQSIVNMNEQWKMMDEYISQTPMPDIYRDWSVEILCSDCHSKTVNNFHVVGIKCKECGGYNTRRIGNEVSPEEIQVLNNNDNDNRS